MSYDISLYPRSPGQDWAEVIEADQVDGPAMDQAQLDAGVATFRRIEARLREQLTEPVEVWVAEETGGDVVGELTGTATGLQVELYDRSAQVSFPVVHQRGAEARAGLHDAARRAVRIVSEETGYEAYDDQTRRGFDGLIDEDGLEADDFAPAYEGDDLAGAGTGLAGTGAGAGTAGGAGAGTAGVAGTDAVAGSAQPDGTTPAATAPTNAADAFSQMDPAMLRRRATLYLVVGGLMVAYGFWRFSAGDGGWLTWLVVAFAVFNLLGGFMLRNVAEQAKNRQAAGAGAGAGAGTVAPGQEPGPGALDQESGTGALDQESGTGALDQEPRTGTTEPPEDGTPPQR